MSKVLLIAVAGSILLAVGVRAQDRELDLAQLGTRARALLASGVGDSDPGLCERLARGLAPSDLVSAFYKGTRAERLMAIDAAGSSPDPWGVLPHLGALMGARDRQVASRSAGSLLRLLGDAAGRMPVFSETVPGQVAQLAGQLESVSLDVRLDPDIRATALRGIRQIRTMGVPGRFSPIRLLEDPNRGVSRAALTLIDVPVDETTLMALAEMASGDEDPWMQGQAAALLCENALFHGAKAPSKDLSKLLKSVLANPEVPSGAVAGVLACLKHFPPETRIDLVDLALSRPDPSVKAFWKALLQEN